MSRNIFNLALDFYQAPAEHRDLLEPAAPLPQDISFLLDALIENKDPRSEQPKELPADLHAAIQFLIERVFFAPGANCYRNLGLNIGAGTEDIRKHYNQLLHIFALDQADRSGEWNASYATQINRAYSVLRDPERRAAYDHSLLHPTGGRGVGSPARESRVDAEPGKAPRKVSYLNPAGVPPARTATAEQEIRELQAQLSKGTQASADAANPIERKAPEPVPKSSFIANRIDRASGIAESPGAAPSVKLASGEETARTLLLEHAAGAADHFPKGIPITAPEPDANQGRRIFAMDRATFALMTAVILVLIVYAIVLPNRFQGESESQMEAESGAINAPPADMSNGNIVREQPSLSESDVSVTPPPLAHDAGAANAGKNAGASVSRDANMESSASAAATTGDPVKPQAEARPSAAATTAESGRVGGAGSEGKPATSAAAKVETPKHQTLPDKAAPGSTAARKDTAPATGTALSNAGVGDSSPAKKLESMRQSTQPKSATAASPAPATRVPPADNGTTAGAKPPQPKAPSVAEVPGRQAQPPSTAPKAPAAETGAIASVTPAQPAQNDITIQELDRLGETFSRAYEMGDLALLVNLFSEDARTNDQSSRAGIEQDYRDLFELSESRTFTFGRLRWEQDKNGGGLKGEGDFQANVQLKGETGATTVHGKVVFHVKRAPQGIVITEMLHTYN